MILSPEWVKYFLPILQKIQRNQAVWLPWSKFEASSEILVPVCHQNFNQRLGFSKPAWLRMKIYSYASMIYVCAHTRTHAHTHARAHLILNTFLKILSQKISPQVEGWSIRNREKTPHMLNDKGLPMTTHKPQTLNVKISMLGLTCPWLRQALACWNDRPVILQTGHTQSHCAFNSEGGKCQGEEKYAIYGLAITVGWIMSSTGIGQGPNL